MGLFSFLKPKSEKEKLEAEYKKLMQQSFDLSKTNRTESDKKLAEANSILEKIEQLKD